jgi:hypothetical protein
MVQILVSALQKASAQKTALPAPNQYEATAANRIFKIKPQGLYKNTIKIFSLIDVLIQKGKPF